MMLCLPKVKSIIRTWPVLTLTTTITIVWYTIFLSIGWNGWPSSFSSWWAASSTTTDDDELPNCFQNYLTDKSCFCERPRPNTLLAQPANTLSNLAFTMVALFIAWSADAQSFPFVSWWTEHDNIYTGNTTVLQKWYVMAYTSIAAFLGPGSMFLHASMTHWGGMLDVISMLLLICFISVLMATRLVLTFTGWNHSGNERIVQVWAPLGNMVTNALLMTITIGGYVHGRWNPTRIFAILMFVTIGGELLVRFLLEFGWWKNHKRRKANIWLYLLTIVLFGGAYAIWIPSQSGGAFCHPNSIVQGHALWHILSALAVASGFYYQVSEHTILLLHHGDNDCMSSSSTTTTRKHPLATDPDSTDDAYVTSNALSLEV